MAEPNLAAAITALIIAYQSAKDLFQSVRLLDNHWRKSAGEVAREQQLMNALKDGESSISRRYTAIYSELGEQYRMGDGVSQQKLFQTADLVNNRIVRQLQIAIKYDDVRLDYERMTQDAVLFKRAALGILETLRNLFLPEKLVLDTPSELSTLDLPSASPPLPHPAEWGYEAQPFADLPSADTHDHAYARPSTPLSPMQESPASTRMFSSRKAKREAGFSAAPMDLSLLRHFGSGESNLHASPTRSKRNARPDDKSWYPVVEVPVVLDTVSRPTTKDSATLGAWEKWRQSEHLVASHANMTNARASSEYSYHDRSSSEYSSPAQPPLGEHPAMGRQETSSADESSVHMSRSSSQSNASTDLTSPASSTDSCDWNELQKPLMIVPVSAMDQAPPAIPVRSPLRTLAHRPRGATCSTVSSSPTSSSLEHHRSFSSSSIAGSISSTSSVVPTSVTLAALTRPVAPPSKSNNYHGFCKGAWAIRESVSDGIKLRTRPAGLYVTCQYFQCRQCTFQTSPVQQNNKVIDTRVYAAAGILYRWAFLAKSHTKRKSDTKPAYGCQFCCAEGRPCGVYGTVDMLMGHIITKHAEGVSAEVLKETKCIYGRVASPQEEFDICIPVSSSRRPLFGSIAEELEA